LSAPPDPLRLAREAARLALQPLAQLAKLHVEDSDARGWARSLYSVLDSLETRARSGPQLLATWGPAAFLLFTASKAVEADPRLQEAMAELLKGKPGWHEKLSNTGKNLGATASGYLLYAAALLYYHLKTGIVGPGSNIAEMFDEAIRYYLDASRSGGRRGYSTLLAYTQALARFTELYAKPLLNKYENRLNKNDAARGFLEDLGKLGGLAHDAHSG